MKAKKFLVIFCLLAVALFAVACGEEETTTAEPVVTTTTEATTTAATTTKAATTAATTTVAATTKATTKATTAATTTTVATTVAPAPVAPADPYLWNGNVATAFAGGTGTAEDPYQIANGAQLALMAETFEKGAYYILVDDIMLNDVYNWNEWGNGDYLKPLNPWTPIEGFNANFDGKGKTIYGLYGIPLFATTRDATVINIGLAYTKVNGSVLIGTATDTNINGITIDTDTLVFNGKDDITFPANATIDDIMEITGTKWLITLGANPEVWTFEGLAEGALATDLFVANDKLGTSFNVTIVDGKGYTEEEEPASNKALAWDANDANANTIVLNITKDATATFNWHFATEVIVYVDGSAQAGAYEFGISLIDAAGKTWTLAKDKSVSTLDGKAWKEFKATGATVALEDGYKGWVRIPFASFTDGENGAIDTLNNSIAQIALTYKNASATDEGTFYIDSVRLVYPEGQNAAPNTIPNLNPAYGITFHETFADPDAIKVEVPSGHVNNVATVIKDGKLQMTWLNDYVGPDSAFNFNAKVPTDAKGFLIYIDAADSKMVDQNRANDDLFYYLMVGLRLKIDGKTWCAGGTRYGVSNALEQNAVYLQCSDGGWARVINLNNNRAPLPEHKFTGWMYLPAENLSQNGINELFLDDYLASKDADVDMTQVMIYTAAENGKFGGSNSNRMGVFKDTVVKFDSFAVVSGENAPEITLDAPAKLPDGLDYKVNQSIDFENTDIFFTVENDSEKDVKNDGYIDLGAITTDKGYNNSGAWSTTTNDNGTGKSTISTIAGANLSFGYIDAGLMMYVNVSELVPLEGKDFISLKIGIATFASGQIRADNLNALAADGGNYFNLTLNNNGSTNSATGYVVDEDGEWTPVYNSSNRDYLDIPAGYEGYLYIPFTEIHRSAKLDSDAYNSGNGASGMPVIRLIHTEIMNTQGGGKSAYIDQFSVVEWTETVDAEQAIPDEAPATLPGGVEYELIFRVGLEAQTELLKLNGNTLNYKFSTDRAVCGNALSFSPLSTSSRGEMYIDLDKNVSLKGAKGVLFYVDFTNVECTKDNAVATVTLGNNTYRSYKDNAAKGYYLAKGSTEWVETKNAAVKNDRMLLPNNFAGWVYVPVEGYAKSSDQTTPIDTETATITQIRLYTDGYTFDTSKFVTFDEVMIVK